MAEETTEALQDKAHGFINNPFIPFLTDRKLDGEKAALRLQQEINAKETKIIKVKGAVNPADLPKTFKIIATSGVLAWDKEGAEVYGSGETIIRYDPVAWGTRQTARQDLVMYLGLKPAEKTDPIKGDITLKVIYDDNAELGKKNGSGTRNSST